MHFTDPVSCVPISTCYPNAAVPKMDDAASVARLMVSGVPSRQYVVTSVSGFAFHGNAGNIINGYVDANGLRFDRWGSNDPDLEGFYDLGELMIPTGTNDCPISVERGIAGPDLVSRHRTVRSITSDAFGYIRSGRRYGDERIKRRARHSNVAG